MVCRLREAGTHALGDVAPVRVCDGHFLRVLSCFPRGRAEKGDDVVGDVVLDGGAVADGVDVSKRGAREAEMGVRLERVAVVLVVCEFLGDFLAKVGL